MSYGKDKFSDQLGGRKKEKELIGLDHSRENAANYLGGLR